MRPFRKILLACGDEEIAGPLAFTLRISRFTANTGPYSVTMVRSPQEALEALAVSQYHLLLCQTPMDGIDVLLERAQLIDAEMFSIVLIGDRKSFSELWKCDNILYKAASAEILERIRCLMVRKPGPKLGSKKPVKAETVAVAQEEVVA